MPQTSSETAILADQFGDKSGNSTNDAELSWVGRLTHGSLLRRPKSDVFGRLSKDRASMLRGLRGVESVTCDWSSRSLAAGLQPIPNDDPTQNDLVPDSEANRP